MGAVTLTGFLPLRTVLGATVFDTVYVATVTLTTTSGVLWWKRTKSEKRTVARRFVGSWYFVETGVWCPLFDSIEIEALERGYYVREALRASRESGAGVLPDWRPTLRDENHHTPPHFVV